MGSWQEKQSQVNLQRAVATLWAEKKMHLSQLLNQRILLLSDVILGEQVLAAVLQDWELNVN